MSEHKIDAHDTATVNTTRTPWFRVPASVTAKHFPFKPETLVEISADDRIDHAFHKLVASNVLSAPVYDEKAKQYLGFFDVTDVLSLHFGMKLMLSCIPEEGEEAESFEEGESDSGELTAHGKVASLFGANAASRPAGTSWQPVDENTPLMDVLRLLSGSARRVPVVSSETGRVVKIISQSAVVSEVYASVTKATHLPEEFKLTPRQTGIGMKKVMTVRDSTPVKTAFQLMVKEDVSAVGVVDEEDKIFSCVSTKDIRLMPSIDRTAMDGRALLNHSTREYIALARRASEVSGKSHAPVAVVGLDTPLLTVIGKLAATKMHRIFLIDQQNKAVGVISVSDIISLLMQQALAATAPPAKKA